MVEDLVIPELFSQAVSRFPDKVALEIKRDNHWQGVTYRDLEERSLKLATFLIREGFKKGDTASLILENRPEWVIIYLGMVQAGLVCVPLDPQLNAQEIKNLILDSAARIIFCSFDVFTKKIKDNIQSNAIKIVVLDMPDSEPEKVMDFALLEEIHGDKSLMPRMLPQDIASLIYTSGTTAQPKGVLLSHANICSNFKSLEKLKICTYADNILSILPLHHTYAFMVTLIVPLFSGARVTYGLSLKPQDLIQIIKESRVTILVGVPQLFSMLHKIIFERIKKIPSLFLPLAVLFIKNKIHRLWGRDLRLLVSGGARLEPRMARDLSRLLGLKIIEGYGLTETSPVVTLNPPQRIKFGSVGRPIADVQIKILNPDKSGVGQVLIKGPNVMQGYFKHPEWTREAIKEEWFHSGDLGYIDSGGYLYLVGREKEVIVLSSGKNIYPEELEGYYSKSPYIKEICILSKPEEKFGRTVESLHAIIVPNLEYFRQLNLTDIRGKIRWELENLSRNLPYYQHVMGFTVTKEELPRTALKKLKRYQVRQRFLPGLSRQPEVKGGAILEEGLEGIDRDIAQKIIDYVSGQVKKRAYLDSHLEIDLGIDSLTRVELGLGLEGIFKIKIPDEGLYIVSTVKELIMYITGLINKTERGIYQPEEVQRSWSQILNQIPAEKITRKIRIEPVFLDILLTWIFKNIFLLILRIFWFLRIRGKENLPAKGPYIICSNHASYLDGFVISSSLRFPQVRNLFFLGYSEILEYPLIRPVNKIARLISIDPAVHLTEAMQAASFVLAQKKIVCIFPEGRRSVDENIGEFKRGVGILIKELNISVVPVYIKGSHQSWPRGLRLPRFYPLKVIFGRPLLAQELLERKETESLLDDYAVIARRLKEEVRRLAC